MKKKYFIGLLVIVICLILIGCGKEPETTTIFIATKDGIKNAEVDSLQYVSTKEKILQTGKNTATNKQTGEMYEYVYTNVEYEITALKEGKTNLVLEYIDPKTDEPQKDVYDIEVDKDLNLSVNKQ